MKVVKCWMLSDCSIICKGSRFGVKKLMVAGCWCSVGKKKEGNKTSTEPGGTPHRTVAIHPGFLGTVPETRRTSLLFNFSDFFPSS